MLSSSVLQSITLLIIGGFVGWVVGVVLERAVLPVIAQLFKKTSWRIDDMIIRAWQGVISWICLVAGLYFTSQLLTLSLSENILFDQSITFGLVMLFTWGVARMIASILSYSVERARGVGGTSSMISAITYLFVFAVGTLVGLQTIGIAIGPIIATLGIGGLAVALAIRPVLEDIFAGIQILLSNTVKPGDYIEINEEHKGYVVEIDWRTTTLDSFGNSQKIIPNSVLVKSIVINYDRPLAPYAVKMMVGVSYDSDLEKVEKVAIDEAKKVVKKSEVAVKDYEPVVRFKRFDDSSIAVQIIIKSQNYTDQYLLEHELIKAIFARFKKEKITIPFPIREVKLQKK